MLKAEKAQPGYEYVTRLDLKYDLDELDAGLESIINLLNGETQVCATAIPGSCDPHYDGNGRLAEHLKEANFSEITPCFQGTIFERILQDLNITWGRARVMKLVPQHTMFMHPDMGWRYHVALRTNPNCFLFFRDTEKAYHIPVDGYVYKMDATKWHTAFNAGHRDRYHFVINDGNCFDDYVAY